MAQTIWYLKHGEQVFGPFPSPQIAEALNIGEVTPEWEVSLNGVDWLGILDSGQFKAEETASTIGETDETLAWHEQRQQARKRWLQEGAGVTGIARNPELDAAARKSIARDHIRTQVLLREEKNKRRSPWIVLLALALLVGVGIAVWLGQSDKPIQAGIGLSVDCAAVLRDHVNWTGCVKPNISQPNAIARNARMDKARLDGANLRGADLSYATMNGASLRNADLGKVVFTGADFSGADLSGADLSAADLRYAVLSNANLAGVRLSGTQLEKATWIDGRVCASGSLDQCK